MYLQGDPKRQAVSTIKAFEYQIWQSVLAWIRLAEDEILFLEGAEDFDKYQPGNVEVTQVKHSPQPITLRSKDIIQAINNFWVTKTFNPGREVRYRYLTVAEPTIEKGNPFGRESGLALWERSKDPETDLTQLAGFLNGLEDLAYDLRKFIQESDCQTLRSKLIVPISWDTGSPSYDQIREEVERLVIYHGDRFPLPPDEAKRAIPHLREKVYETICREADRRLERKDFLESFQRATSISVQISTLNTLLQQSYGGDKGPINTGGHLDLHQQKGLRNCRPPFPEPLLKRECVVSAVNERWRDCGILFITGSAATGKSILAGLVTHNQGWLWANFRGADSPNITMHLGQTAYSLLAGDEWRGAVLDDLDFGRDFRIFETELNAFLDLLLSGKRKAIITSQSSLPTRLQELFGSKGICQVTVPNLDESELREFVLAHGCPEDERLDAWVNIVRLRTSGHPKLAHAQILNLRFRGWPKPAVGDLVDTRALADVYEEARQRLLEDVPHEEARSLAYRLSVFVNPFRREHAVALGTKALGNPPVPVRNAGEAFDRLLHGWIERLPFDYYQLTPLLSGAARQLFDTGTLQTIHAGAANALLVSQPIGTIEARAIVHHGFVGREGLPIQVVIGELLRHVHDEAWSKIRQDYLWLLFLSNDPGEQIFPSDASTSLLLRVFQFRIAGETGNFDLAIKIKNAWEHEIECLQDSNLKARMRLTFLSQIVMNMEVPISLKCVANSIMEALNILRRFNTDAVTEPNDLLKSPKLARGLLNFVAPRCDSMGDLRGLFEAMEEDLFSTMSEFLKLLEENLERLLFLFDHAWIVESNSTQPRWPESVDLFEKIAVRSMDWQAHLCAAVAYRCIVVIHSEYLMDPSSALDVLAKAEKELPGEHFLLQHTRAKLLYDDDEFSKALQVWEPLVEQWVSPPVQVAFQISSWGQICAGYTDSWSVAAKMARYGEDVASARGFVVKAIGFRADEAFALWKAGEHDDSIATFASVLDAFESLPDPDHDLSSYTLQKLVGHAIGWACDQVNPSDSDIVYGEPPAARFSNSELDERIRELPLASPIGLWWMLARVECQLELGDWAFRRLETESRGVNRPDMLIMAASLRVERALIGCNFDDLLSLYLQYLDEFRSHKAQILVEQGALPDDLRKTIQADTSTGFDAHTLEILMVLDAAMVRLAGRGRITDAPIAKWRLDFSQYGVTDRRAWDWLFLLQNAATVGRYELRQIMEGADRDNSLRALASLLILTHKGSESIELLYASVLLVTWMSKNRLCDIVGDNLESLIVKAWSHVAEKQMLIPDMGTNAILEACNDSSRGIRKAARICLAARDGVSLEIGNMVAELERIASTGCLRWRTNA